MTKIALLDDYQNVALQMADWRRLGADVEVIAFPDHLSDVDALAARLAGFEIVGVMRERTAIPRTLFERLPDLKLIVTTGPWNAVVDMKAAAEFDVTVCGTGGTIAATAELTWGLILAAVRNIHTEDRALREGQWQTAMGIELAGRTLGLLGLGNIGAQVARVGNAFGMDVIAWSQNLTHERAQEHGAKCVSREELFAQSDVLSIHTILSRRTRGLIGASDLAHMKPTAYLINTSRGPIIEEQALIDTLKGNKIAGAALDVYHVEPLPADHPFRTLDNLLMTPHIGYVAEETYRVFYEQTLEDIEAYLKGTPKRVLRLPDKT